MVLLTYLVVILLVIHSDLKLKHRCMYVTKEDNNDKFKESTSLQIAYHRDPEVWCQKGDPACCSKSKSKAFKSMKISIVISYNFIPPKYFKEWSINTNSKLEYLEKISRLVYKYLQLFYINRT